MTVVFHALLTSTFNISVQQGYKVVLRGNSPFSWNPSKQVEIQAVRELHGGNYLLEGKAKLTLREASRTIAYKYVVVPHQRRTAKDKDLWECLIGFRPVVTGKHVNRCLRIPESSIKVNGTWHQYDDAIFSQPGLWESIRSLFPHNENDPAEGRRLAMTAMLPDWESISLKQGGMNAHDALSKINNVVHCMSKAEVENGGLFRLRVPYGFNILEVLHEYLFPQLNRNIRILRVHTDDEDSHTKRLITSTMIASLAVLHQLTFHGDDELKNLLECLLINGESGRPKCIEYDALLSQFPKEKHLR
ncbi:E3 ubiquitin-protein ligase RNF213-like [Orbicella faveolata]|uniref:E3 ubiquitin-protein ligase RNF213-like n=1 Tax=Orbicella faveolata TaxID=48498 RepID=UPI0009E37E14|nr:E3 ubiquitin-protein ligase RNF213-like [Orbicella faveolata]